MGFLPFLDFPLTVRQQIYEELLVPPLILNEEGKPSEDDVAVDILYTNRQIYAESSDIFYTKNLFVVVRSNHEGFFEEGTRDRIPVFREIKNPSKISHCSRMSMSIEMLGVSGLLRFLCAEGTSEFVITARALPIFASAIIGQHKFRTGTGAVRFQVHETFRYTKARFSDLVFGRFLAAEQLPKFKAVTIEGPIEHDHRVAIISNCAFDEPRACSRFFLGLRCYSDRVWFRIRMEKRADRSGIMKEIPERQIHEIPRLLIRQIDFHWDCHYIRGKELGHVCSHDPAYLFDKMASVYNLLVFGYLLAAKRRPEQAMNAYLEARRAAEDGIKYLNREDRIVYPSQVEESEQEKWRIRVSRLNSAKILLSLKAAKACTKIGDCEAAVAYIKDAATFTPHMQPERMEMLIKLELKEWPELPADSPYVSPAVLWKMEAVEETTAK